MDPVNQQEIWRERRRKHRHQNPKIELIAIARKRSRTKGIPFELTVDDFEMPEHCPILGIRLCSPDEVDETKKRPWDNSPSLDRIDPAQGYVKGNVRVISYKANAMRRNASLEDVENLYKFLKQEQGVE